MTTIAAARKAAISAVIIGGAFLAVAGIEAASSLEQAKLQNQIKLEELRSNRTVELTKLRLQQRQAACHDALQLAGDETPNKGLLEKGGDANQSVVKLLTYCAKDDEQ